MPAKCLARNGWHLAARWDPLFGASGFLRVSWWLAATLVCIRARRFSLFFCLRRIRRPSRLRRLRPTSGIDTARGNGRALGFNSYHNEGDRKRTEAAAHGHGSAGGINKGPGRRRHAVFYLQRPAAGALPQRCVAGKFMSIPRASRRRSTGPRIRGDGWPHHGSALVEPGSAELLRHRRVCSVRGRRRVA